MNAVRQRLSSHHHGVMILLAFVLMLRVLIPQGMMATPSATGGVAVLLCDGSGVAGRIDLPLGEKPANAAKTDSCAFGVLAHAATCSPQDWSIPPIQPQPAFRERTVAAFQFGAAPHPHPPVRAPPAAA